MISTLRSFFPFFELFFSLYFCCLLPTALAQTGFPAYPTYVSEYGLPIEYCSSGTPGPTIAKSRWIDKVKIGTLENASGSSKDTATPGYEDFSHMELTLDNSIRNSVEVVITPGYPVLNPSITTVSFRLFVDFNKNGRFNDSGENVTSGTGGPGPITSAFQIYSGARTGRFRMRLVLIGSSSVAAAQSCPHPTNIVTSGETEDYTLNIISPNGTPPQCSDKLDNDGDGERDYPTDYGCQSPNDNDEGDYITQCQDGIDNDGDGLIDLNDPGCLFTQDDDESDEDLATNLVFSNNGSLNILRGFSSTGSAVFSKPALQIRTDILPGAPWDWPTGGDLGLITEDNEIVVMYPSYTWLPTNFIGLIGSNGMPVTILNLGTKRWTTNFVPEVTSYTGGIFADANYIYLTSKRNSALNHVTGIFRFDRKTSTTEWFLTGKEHNWQKIIKGKDGFLYALDDDPQAFLLGHPIYKISPDTMTKVGLKPIRIMLPGQRNLYNFGVDNLGRILAVGSISSTGANGKIYQSGSGALYRFTVDQHSNLQLQDTVTLPDQHQVVIKDNVSTNEISNAYGDLEICDNGSIWIGALSSGYTFAYSADLTELRLNNQQPIIPPYFGSGSVFIACSGSYESSSSSAISSSSSSSTTSSSSSSLSSSSSSSVLLPSSSSLSSVKSSSSSFYSSVAPSSSSSSSASSTSSAASSSSSSSSPGYPLADNCVPVGSVLPYSWIGETNFQATNSIDFKDSQIGKGFLDLTSSTEPLLVTPGSTVSYQLKPGTISLLINLPIYWALWLDLNRDGRWSPSERMLVASSSSAITGSFAIPANATPGAARMRIAAQWYGDTSFENPCPSNNPIYGQFRDLPVTIESQQDFTSSSSTSQPPISSSSSASSTSLSSTSSSSYSSIFQSSSTSAVSSSSSSSISPAPQQPYCQHTSSPTGTVWIAALKLQGVNSIESPVHSGQSYSDNTPLTLRTRRGEAVSFALRLGGKDYPTSIGLFVDYNSNGNFEDFGETTFNTELFRGSSELTGQFTVPASAKLGATRLRVVAVYQKNGMPAKSCYPGYIYGEVEDFSLEIF